MPSTRPDRPMLAVLGGLFVAAAAFALVMVRPFATASIGPDAAAPVIHFERIFAGRHLEGYLGQTPKPLLTAVYGALYSVTHDWRSIAWAAIAAYGLAVVLATALVWRIGGRASAAFAAVAFTAFPTLLLEVVYAYAVPWALVAWLLAGLALSADRPRYGLAGIALLVGSLARIETLSVVAIAAVALILAEIRARRVHRPRPPPSAYLLLIGFLAIPLMLTHDWLLTGDPWFWANIARLNSEAARSVRSPIQVAAWQARHLLEMAPLLPFAALGVAVVIRRRQWAIGLGLLALGPGVAAFLVFLAARGIFVSARYLAPIDLTVLFAAALGVAIVDVPIVRRWLRRHQRSVSIRMLLPVAAGAAAAFAFAPMGPVDPNVRRTLAEQIQLHANAHQAMAAIRGSLATPPSWRNGSTPAAGVGPLVFVPSQIRAQAVVDLDLPLWAVAKSKGSAIAPTQGRPRIGQIFYRDRVAIGDSASYGVFEIDQPIDRDGYRLVPIEVDPKRGLWVIRVDAATP